MRAQRSQERQVVEEELRQEPAVRLRARRADEERPGLGRDERCVCASHEGARASREGASAAAPEARLFFLGLQDALGPDPSLKTRKDADTPAGLRNLGATCYLGSLVQVLFHNAEFRERLYDANSSSGCATRTARDASGGGDANGNDVVKVLQCIFADLDQGKRSSCDVTVRSRGVGARVSFFLSCLLAETVRDMMLSSS